MTDCVPLSWKVLVDISRNLLNNLLKRLSLHCQNCVLILSFLESILNSISYHTHTRYYTEYNLKMEYFMPRLRDICKFVISKFELVKKNKFHKVFTFVRNGDSLSHFHKRFCSLSAMKSFLRFICFICQFV